MWNIINALILRELKTRFGKNPKLGYIWVVFEPMMHILFMLIIFTFIRNRVLPQLPFSLFLISGMVPFFMFRNIVTFMMNGINANKSLFTYKPVRPIHVFLARALLEGFIYFVIFCILMIGAGILLGYSTIPFNTIQVFLFFVWLILFAFSLGLFLSVVLYNKDIFKNLIMYLFNLLYFASGTIFPIWVFPDNLIEILSYNPVLHILEMFKENYFQTYPTVEQVNYQYPLVFTLILLFFGLGIYYKKRVELATA